MSLLLRLRKMLGISNNRGSQLLDPQGSDTRTQETESNGLLMASLLLNSSEWIVRIVDSLRFIDAERTRMHTSFDVEIGENFPSSGVGDFLVPLGLYKKGAIRIMDMRGPDGNPLPVSNSHKNSRVASSMLMALLPSEAWRNHRDCVESRELVNSLVRLQPGDESSTETRERLSDFRKKFESHDSLKEDWDIFEEVSMILSEHFILLVSLDKSYAGRRCVLKFSMDVDIARQAGTRRAIVISVANLGMAESHHFEVRLPHELIISSFTVISADASIAPTANVDGSIGHLHFGRLSERFPEGEVIAEVAPRTGGPLTLAGWSTLCVSLFAAASIPARIFDRWFFPEGVEIPSTAVSLVLAIATAILSRHVWSHRHEVSAAVFSPSTKIQTANLITLVAIALLSSLPVTPLLWHIFWGLAYLSSGLAVWVYFANTRATKRSLIEEGSGNGRT